MWQCWCGNYCGFMQNYVLVCNQMNNCESCNSGCVYTMHPIIEVVFNHSIMWNMCALEAAGGGGTQPFKADLNIHHHPHQMGRIHMILNELYSRQYSSYYLHNCKRIYIICIHDDASLMSCYSMRIGSK